MYLSQTYCVFFVDMRMRRLRAPALTRFTGTGHAFGAPVAYSSRIGRLEAYYNGICFNKQFISKISFTIMQQHSEKLKYICKNDWLLILFSLQRLNVLSWLTFLFNWNWQGRRYIQRERERGGGKEYKNIFQPWHLGRVSHWPFARHLIVGAPSTTVRGGQVKYTFSPTFPPFVLPVKPDRSTCNWALYPM